MKGKANPFANLLSQLAPVSAPTAPDSPEAMDDPEAMEAVDNKPMSCDESGSDQAEDTGSTSFKFGQTSKLSYCLEAYQHNKKRKADKPKKNSAGSSSETIVPKKPRNLFMMMDFQRGFGVNKNAADEYTFEDEVIIRLKDK